MKKTPMFSLKNRNLFFLPIWIPMTIGICRLAAMAIDHLHPTEILEDSQIFGVLTSCAIVSGALSTYLSYLITFKIREYQLKKES